MTLIVKKPRKENFGVTLDVNLIKQLKELAKSYKISVSSLTEQLLQQAVANLKGETK